MGLEVFASLGLSFEDLTEDVQTTFASLCQSTLEDFVAKTIDLDIHLSSGDTVSGTRYLEVHITEMVFVTEDVGEDRVVRTLVLRDQTHGDTRYGLSDGYTSVTQSERTSTYCSHRRRAVRLEDVGDDTDYVGVLSWEHALEGAVSEVPMTDLTAADTTLWASVTGREGREVIVEEESFLTVVEYVVDELLIALRTQRDRRQRLRLTTGEDCRAVRSGQVICFDPDRTDLGGLTTVKALAFVEDSTAHSFLLDIMVVASDERSLRLEFLFGELSLVFLYDSIKGLSTSVLVGARYSYGVGLSVAGVVYILAQVFVVLFVAVGALDELTYSFAELKLSLALYLDSFVGYLDSLEHFSFLDFLHFPFDHHDVIEGSPYHELDISRLKLLEGGVDDEFAIDAGDAYLTDRTVEGDVRYGEGCRSSEPSQSIRHIYTIRREENDIDEDFGMVVIWEEGAQGTVYETTSQDFIVRSLAFAAREATREATESGILLLVLDLEGHKVNPRIGILGCAYSGQQDGIPHAKGYGTVSLLG